MMTFACFDFETDRAQPSTATVIQVAFAVADLIDAALVERTAKQVLCFAAHVPIGSTEVHKLRASDLVGKHPFEHHVPTLGRVFGKVDYVVTFNGTGFDVRIYARYASLTSADVQGFQSKHIDVYRAWRRIQLSDKKAACYSGSLAGAHFYFTGETFDGAHDATEDCRATLRVLAAMLRAGLALADLVRWSSLPLPGYADIEGKLRWVGDVLTLGFGKQAGEDIATIEPSMLRFMIDGDFPDDVKGIVRQVLAGGYPARRWEDE